MARVVFFAGVQAMADMLTQPRKLYIVCTRTGALAVRSSKVNIDSTIIFTYNSAKGGGGEKDH